MCKIALYVALMSLRDLVVHNKLAVLLCKLSKITFVPSST